MPPLGSSEEAILARVSRMARSPRKGRLIHGIGDDCAVFRPKGSNEDLLFTSDMMIEDVHFRRATHPASAVGHKALARSLSDIAAMGGEPRFCLLSLALPPWADQRWLDQFYRGFLKLAHRTGAWLAGGDLAHAERFSCDVTVCGGVPKGKALLRAGAKPRDDIFVSGGLGHSAYGLSKGRGKAWQSHLRPTPQLALGKFVREKLGATAAMDL
ncbi:MAG: thiamine-phosphate kinase, partial [Bryobacteraceae bacterium]